MSHPEPESLSLDAILRRPERLEQMPACQERCPSGSDVRQWIGWIAQRERLGLTLEQALERSWRTIVETNPFPATMGRICPHPCEGGCTRQGKEGPVSIHELERFVGDWAIERDLDLPVLHTPVERESIGVIGAGPAGLSLAYQMQRRGYPVTVYERESRPGGMLLRGIPEYRLPEEVLAAEIERIVRLGVRLELGCGLGRELTLDELRARHAAVFLGIGAQASRRLGVPGEQGPGCIAGIDLLRAVNEGQEPELGGSVAVIGGGNTAIDAARTARRLGAAVHLLYRRTRAEMPALAEEIECALEEGVQLELLVAPVAVLRAGERLRGIRLQRMRLGDEDSSGRRSPVPIAGSEFELEVATVVAAVSQEVDRAGLEDFAAGRGSLDGDAEGRLVDGIWVGGDARGLGIATLAIAQGRHAAERIDAELRGVPLAADQRLRVDKDRVLLDFYESRERHEPVRLAVEERLRRPDSELSATLSSAEAAGEAERCLSCGSCFGCEQCSMYCNQSGFIRLEEAAPGAYFALNLDACEGCGKCIEVCPCGFLRLT